MQQNINSKLIIMSKNTLIISQILIAILSVVVIFPWLFPSSALGACLIGMFGVENYAPMNFTEVIKHFTMLNTFLGVSGSVIGVLPLLIGAVIMMKLSRNYINGEVFTLANIKMYRKLGIIYLLSAILLQPLSQVLFSLCATINNPVGQRFIRITFDLGNLTAIFFAIMLIVISQVMQLGQRINEEQKLTI